MIVLGLTGSIGMGKTTTAALFAAAGAVVYDADAAVHTLYGAGGAAGMALAADFGSAVGADGGVDRDILKALLKAEPERIRALEAAVFPLVAADRAAFLHTANEEGRALAILDIPLLFETGGEASVDAVVVVTADPQAQTARVLARPGMDAETFAMLSARQVDDGEKRRRADFLVFTDAGLADADRQVKAIVADVLEPGWTPPRTQMLARQEQTHEGHRGV